MAMTRPWPSNPNRRWPKTHCGSANSAAIGAIDSMPGVPGRHRYRFHQPDRSDANTRLPSGAQAGPAMDSVRAARDEVRASPPTRRRPGVRPTARCRPRACSAGPRPASRATRRRATASGWLKKSWPSTSGVTDAVLEAHRHDAVGRLQVVDPVVLQDRQHAAPRPVDAQVREAQAGPGRQRTWCRTRIDAHQVTVAELRVDDQPVLDGPRAAAVLVDPGAHVGRRRRQLGHRAVGREPQQHHASAFVRPTLQQVHIRPVDPRSGQAAAAGHDDVQGDGGRPGAVGQDRWVAHPPQHMGCAPPATAERTARHRMAKTTMSRPAASWSTTERVSTPVGTAITR